MPTRSLTRIFVATLRRPEQPGTAEFERLLQRLIAIGQAVWPRVRLSPETFVRFVARRIPEAVDPRVVLRRMNAPGLYLACGCVEGDPGAVACFERWAAPAIERTVMRAGCDKTAAADARQAIFEKLFVGPRPKIRHYAGAGDLLTWLRVVAQHHAVDTRRYAQREQHLDHNWLAAVLVDDQTPELRLIKADCREAFKTVFRRLLETLDEGDRALLRYKYIDGLSIDQIGAIHRINRATAARRLERLRQRLLGLTLEAVAERLQIQDDEVQPALQLVRSQVGLDLSQLDSDGSGQIATRR